MIAATKVLMHILLVTTLLQLAACAAPPIPRGSMEDLFPGPMRPQASTVLALGRSVQLVQMPGPGHTPIVFIHGSPGSWRSWARYLDAPELSQYGPRIAMDRPGFGDSGASDLMLVAFNDADLGAGVRYEPSRGGDLFPHLYGPLDPKAALWAKPLPLTGALMSPAALSGEDNFPSSRISDESSETGDVAGPVM